MTKYKEVLQHRFLNTKGREKKKTDLFFDYMVTGGWSDSSGSLQQLTTVSMQAHTHILTQ